MKIRFVECELTKKEVTEVINRADAADVEKLHPYWDNFKDDTVFTVNFNGKEENNWIAVTVMTIIEDIVNITHCQNKKEVFKALMELNLSTCEAS